MDVPFQALAEEDLALMHGLGLLFPVMGMNARDREARNEELRRRLREEGLEFCDDASPKQAAASGQGNSGAQQAYDDDLQPGYQGPRLHCLREELPILGIAASTTDHEAQSIQETLVDNGERFWSSEGSSSQEANESLTYQIVGACSRVSTVEITVYKATYQFGFPIYPPREVGFSVGMHPSHMTPLRKRWKVLPNPEPQIFVLPKETPPCRFLQVHLIGKQQMQREDRMYYHAIRRVKLQGERISATALRDYAEQQLAPQREGLGPLLGDPQSMWERGLPPMNEEEGEPPQPGQSAFGNVRRGSASYGQSYTPRANLAHRAAELDEPWQAVALGSQDQGHCLLEL